MKENMEEKNFAQEKNPIQVADRLFQTLETLAETGPITLAGLQVRLQLNKSTVHRLLASLSYMGYVKQDPVTGKYSLSFKMMGLANKILERVDILETVRPYLKQLSEETGETVHFVQMEDVWAVYMAKEYSYRNSVRMVSRVGNRIPLYCSGVGKALLASLSDEAVADIWARSDVRALTPNTVTSLSELLEVLVSVRSRGYAIDDEENELGVRCVAVMLPGPGPSAGMPPAVGGEAFGGEAFGSEAFGGEAFGGPRYALSISAPTSRMSDERVEELGQRLLIMQKEFRQANL